ncbi:HNH endonuclease [Desulforhabdus amnigena]|nr:HNH endonuclease [Desulforhabdus amnigena]NLJ27065.1 HNH endonuclease [Deltaproteobacteria bacterium]
MSVFLVTASPESVRREKEKARALRKTQWWQRQVSKGICYYCRKPTPPEELTMDHVIPLIRDGKSTKGNVVAACKTCNNQKKYLLPIEWEAYLRDFSAEESTKEKYNWKDQSEGNRDGRM